MWLTIHQILTLQTNLLQELIKIKSSIHLGIRCADRHILTKHQQMAKAARRLTMRLQPTIQLFSNRIITNKSIAVTVSRYNSTFIEPIFFKITINE